MNNQWSKELMHKSQAEKRIEENTITEKTIVTPKEQVEAMKKREQLSSKAASDSMAARRLANSDWYERNKAWKKEYNAEYYKKNKAYWEQYYSTKKGINENRSRLLGIRQREADQALREYGPNSEQYKAAKQSVDTNSQWLKQSQGQLAAAEINYERAKEEYNWAATTFAKTPVSSLIGSGYKSILSSGKSFISNFKSGLNTIASKLKSIFS